MNRRRGLALASVVVLVLAACGQSPSPTAPGSAATTTPPAYPTGPGGPTGPTPSLGATGEPATPMPPSATAPASANPAPSPAATSVPRLTLASADFRSGGRIPVRFTCDGRDVSPSLSWTGVPTGTRRLALIVDDPDANHFIHWIAYAIDPEAARLGEGAGAANSALRQGTNDFGRVGYGGPCPPSGTHRYVFTLYALAGPLGLDGNPRGAAVRAALAGAVVLAKATLTATYAR